VVLVFFTRMASAWRHSEREVASLRERFARNEGIIDLATHAASVAHELNTPLATLTLMVEEFSSEARTAAEREQCATMLALLEVCSDRVRELARPADAGEGRDRQAADVEGLIDRWRLVRPTVELRRTGSNAALKRVDPAVGHLIQALLNNAADASGQGGSPQVHLHIESSGTGLRVAIRDFGPGLGQMQPLLPGTLFRTSKPGGMGIGLALSHATVERLGGTLSMQAAPDGPGVVVSFELPMLEQPA
jgi:two-component system sensor histidine kinase RegB